MAAARLRLVISEPYLPCDARATEPRHQSWRPSMAGQAPARQIIVEEAVEEANMAIGSIKKALREEADGRMRNS